jgi:predicted Zn-dependent peptidase
VNVVEAALSNGVRVVLAPMPRARTHVYVHLRGGPVHEDDSTWGLSHLVEHMVFRGTGALRDVVDVTRAADDFGGDIGAATYRDRVCFDTRCDVDRLADACDLLAGFLRAPRFASLRIERKIVEEEIADLVDDNGNDLDAENAVFSRAFDGERLARSIEATPRVVRKYGEAAVRAFHRHAYRGGNVVVTVAGPTPARRALEIVRRTFGRLPAGPPPPPGTAPGRNKRRGLEIIRVDAAQTTVRVAFRGPGLRAREHQALQVLARVLDDGPASRLQQRLVDEQGLAYSVWAFADAYEDGSLLELGGTVRHERVAALTRALVREARALAKAPPTAGEVRRVAARHARDVRDLADDPAALAEALGRGVLLDDRFVPSRASRELAGISPRHVHALARAVLRGPAAVVLAGDPRRREIQGARQATASLATAPRATSVA